MKYKHLELMINFSIDFNEEFKREIVCFQLFEIHFISRKKEKIPVSGASLIRDSINRCSWGGGIQRDGEIGRVVVRSTLLVIRFAVSLVQNPRDRCQFPFQSALTWLTLDSPTLEPWKKAVFEAE